MDTGTSRDYLNYRLERCQDDLAWAKQLLELGNYRLSMNRSYYAIFHIVSAALAALGHTRRKHSGVEAAFHEYLIKPGFIEPEYGPIYKLARQWREEADYALGAEFDEERTRDILQDAEKLVARLERYLREGGFLGEEM